MRTLFEEKLIDDMQCHIMSPLPGTAVSRDPRVRILDKNLKNYGIINNFPVYDLVDPKNNEITFSREQIWKAFNELLELRKQYLDLPPNLSNKPRNL